MPHIDAFDASVAERSRPLAARLALGAVLVLAAAYFVARGPLRAAAAGGSADFRFNFYVALRTFAEGGNPYRQEDLLAAATAVSERHRQFVLKSNNNRVVYPPTLFVLAPLARLPLEAAVRIWMAVQLAAFAALLWTAPRLFDRPWTPPQRWTFVVLGLCLAPAHTSLAAGGTGIVFAALTAALFLDLQRDSPRAGLWLGLLMIKPTFGVPAALATALLGRWRALALGGAIATLAAAPMLLQLGARDAVTGFLANVAAQSAPGMVNDESLLNPQHYQFLNLRPWLLTWLGPGWAEAATAAGLGFTAWGLFRFRRQTRGPGAPFYWTLASALVCLAVYHRFYDATLLMVALAAAMELYCRQNRLVWIWCLTLIPFAAPGATWLHLQLGELPHRMPWMETLLVRHDTLALALLAAAAWWALRAGEARPVAPVRG